VSTGGVGQDLDHDVGQVSNLGEEVELVGREAAVANELLNDAFTEDSGQVERALLGDAPGPIVPPIRLRLSSNGMVVLIEVWDGSTQQPLLKEAGMTADSGRGLMLVDALNARWSWYFPREWGGKVVWAEVQVA
jgi:hypothetical protein